MRCAPVPPGGRLLIDPRRNDPRGHFARLRESVMERLLVAQRGLSEGLRQLFATGVWNAAAATCPTPT
ncbi:hypothetical protein [Streptomyces sp. NPDC058953]|uniref:hypothetical protein n=1 Tax=unclassified Streptomyces TaxID=2593676 RepID=UPI0036AEA093